MGIEYVDGRRFRRAVVAGAEWVLHTRETLNRLNVFPVPDGDTGTNMVLTMQAAYDEIADNDGVIMGAAWAAGQFNSALVFEGS